MTAARRSGPVPRPADQRFREKYAVDAATGCWDWTATKNQKGYGRFTTDYSTFSAHRFAWSMENGEIPDGAFVLHTCDNPACVNPAHLFLGSNADNMADKVAKGRQAQGVGNAYSKLTEAQVMAIRADTRLLRVIGDEYGINKTQVSRIRRRTAWRNLPEIDALLRDGLAGQEGAG